MARMRKPLVVVAALVLLATCRPVRGQGPVEAPRQAGLGAPTLTPPVPNVGAAAPVTAWPPPDYKLPPIDEDMTRPAPDDPLLAYPVLPPAGWFTNVEAGVVAAYFNNHLRGEVPLGTRVDTFQVPSAPLDWTVAPRIELGYRLPRGFGEFLASYQSLSTQGQSALSSALGVGPLNSRLAQNTVNVEYGNTRLLPATGLFGEGWLIGGRAGVQILSIYYDTRSEQRGLDGTLTGQQITNGLVGAGPHAQLEIRRSLFLPGLAFDGSVETANVWDRMGQSFTETILAPGAAPAGNTLRVRLSQGVGSLGARVGLSWMPPANSSIRLFLGYQFNQWWQVGRNGSITSTGINGDLTEHGILFRGEFTF